jgi:GT2 family glycosyltransferase
MEEKLYSIAVILINYNSSDFTLPAVQSIRQRTAPPLDYLVVVVDNNSQPDDYAKLAPLRAYDNVKLVRSRVNLGFAGGNMYGVQFAKARYYYFLNNDCLLLNDCLSILYAFCENNPRVGLCSGQMYDEHEKLQPTFGYFPTLGSKLLGHSLVRLLNPGQYPPQRQAYASPLRVPVISGSSMFVPAPALGQIGGFDTTYFLYLEEEDLAYRVGAAGYEAWLVPEARYQHLGGKSTTRNLAIEKEYYISLLYFYRKYYGRWQTRVMQGLLFFRLARRVFGHRNNGKLALFVLNGAPARESLRHRQKMFL